MAKGMTRASAGEVRHLAEMGSTAGEDSGARKKRELFAASNHPPRWENPEASSHSDVLRPVPGTWPRSGTLSRLPTRPMFRQVLERGESAPLSPRHRSRLRHFENVGAARGGHDGGGVRINGHDPGVVHMATDGNGPAVDDGDGVAGTDEQPLQNKRGRRGTVSLGGGR